MAVSVENARYVVAIVGGATAGSVAAEVLAEAGVLVLVFEQNARPYGKIEDGLPRWHGLQRRAEYTKIDARLGRQDVVFVPRTRLGAELDFQDLACNWGLSALLLANGAWKDRPLTVPGAESFLGRGLAYQNPVIYWFNHKHESGYAGPRYEIPHGAIVIGGGLASIDVIKVVQLEIYGRALGERGVEAPMAELEHEGIPKFCEAHGIDPLGLGIRNGTLYYRRRLEDMPLTPIPAGATPEKLKKAGEVRQRLIQKAREKYLFELQDCCLPTACVVDGDRLAGLMFVRTEVVSTEVRPVAGSEFEVRSELTISSIGSIPEPIPGVEMNGEYYAFKDRLTGEYAAVPGVFGVGNVVTGRGNIRVSFEHGQEVARKIVESYMGLIPRDPAASLLPPEPEERGRDAAKGILESLRGRAPCSTEQIAGILEKVKRLQDRAGYGGDYAGWIRSVSPADLE